VAPSWRQGGRLSGLAKLAQRAACVRGLGLAATVAGHCVSSNSPPPPLVGRLLTNVIFKICQTGQQVRGAGAVNRPAAYWGKAFGSLCICSLARSLVLQSERASRPVCAQAKGAKFEKGAHSLPKAGGNIFMRLRARSCQQAISN